MPIFWRILLTNLVVVLGGAVVGTQLTQRFVQRGEFTNSMHVGLVVVALGGGRRHEAEGIDHAVGLSEIAAPGERVGPDDRPLAVVHARDPDAAQRAAAALREAFTLGDAPPPQVPVIRESLTDPA